MIFTIYQGRKIIYKCTNSYFATSLEGKLDYSMRSYDMEMYLEAMVVYKLITMQAIPEVKEQK